MKNCSKNLRRFPAIEGVVFFFFFSLEQQTVHHVKYNHPPSRRVRTSGTFDKVPPESLRINLGLLRDKNIVELIKILLGF